MRTQPCGEAGGFCRILGRPGNVFDRMLLLDNRRQVLEVAFRFTAGAVHAAGRR
ncbi:MULTISPECIES: hypothetical protein [Frankia]|uniref:hypothetical protein n=1 Tax=Frankia TaxID=1854 RepID=UPI0003141101|nr:MULTISPECIES: hypothetical protein [Frankia]